MKTRLWRLAVVAGCLSAAWIAPTIAEEKDKKDDKKPPEPPVVFLANPLAIAPGGKVKVSFRGQRLDQLKEVATSAAGVELKITDKGKASIPNQQEASRIGDTHFQLEITLPADYAGATLPLVPKNEVDGKAVEGKPFELRVVPAADLVQEKEPNDALGAGQLVELGKTISAQFHQPQNPDVYRLAVEKGKRVEVEVLSWRLGSGCDPFVTIFDPQDQILYHVDDGERLAGAASAVATPEIGRDVRIVFDPAFTGELRILVQDALDQGGPAHPYLLKAAAK